MQRQVVMFWSDACALMANVFRLFLSKQDSSVVMRKAVPGSVCLDDLSFGTIKSILVISGSLQWHAALPLYFS
jgi:hypothetical protein